MGDVVLGELLRDAGRLPSNTQHLDAFLVAVSGEDIPVVLQLAHQLRDGGLRVEYGLKHRAVRHQLELAAARGARRAVIVGPDERRDRVAVIKELGSSDERRVPVDALAKELR
jgi:histidyl-tRNA synthetase